MVLATTGKVILGSIAFAIFWVLAVFPAVPFLPIGRTAGSLLGAMLMVIFGVITPTKAYASIDLSILGLLFGTMVVSIYLERADMFKYLGFFLSWKSKGAKDLLCRISIVSAVSSAFFTNDTSCVVLTDFVLKIASQNNIPPLPFLMALASSANIGSAATPIGNPQNLVIAIQSGISFGEFLLGILPAMLLGVVMNVVVLLCMYWKLLHVGNDQETAAQEVISESEAVSHRFSPARMSRAQSLDSDHLNFTSEILDAQNPPPMALRHRTHISEDSSTSPLEVIIDENENFMKKWKKVLRKSSVYFVTVGMLIAFLMGLDMSWTTLTAALTLVTLDFKDARPSLDKVSYSLLVFFCGMFITVDGFNRTGIPSTLWNLAEPHARIDRVSGIAVLTIVVVILSNIASNVPTVLLLGGRVAASAAAISPSEEKKAWLILAWVSTVAGNLSLLGSAANLIVCEQARNSTLYGYHLSFWNHLKFGVPSTIVVTAIGLTLIKG